MTMPRKFFEDPIPHGIVGIRNNKRTKLRFLFGDVLPIGTTKFFRSSVPHPKWRSEVTIVGNVIKTDAEIGVAKIVPPILTGDKHLAAWKGAVRRAKWPIKTNIAITGDDFDVAHFGEQFRKVILVRIESTPKIAKLNPDHVAPYLSLLRAPKPDMSSRLLQQKIASSPN